GGFLQARLQSFAKAPALLRDTANGPFCRSRSPLPCAAGRLRRRRGVLQIVREPATCGADVRVQKRCLVDSGADWHRRPSRQGSLRSNQPNQGLFTGITFLDPRLRVVYGDSRSLHHSLAATCNYGVNPMSLVEWVVTNKEWLFSGVGVA